MSSNQPRRSITRRGKAGAVIALAGLAAGGLAITQVQASGAGVASVFTLTEPCRLLDTRGSAPLVGPSTQTYDASGTNGDCTLPDGMTAIAVNLTTTKSTARTFLTAFPADTDRPLASTINPGADGSVAVNAATISLDDTGFFKLYLDAGSSDVIIDVLGYYTPGSGAVGPQGAVGPRGETGPQGEAGPKGDAGDTGATGAKGDVGNTGAVGPMGNQGNQGFTGAKGDKGDTGDTGAVGPVGPQGDPGPVADHYVTNRTISVAPGETVQHVRVCDKFPGAVAIAGGATPDGAGVEISPPGPNGEVTIEARHLEVVGSGPIFGSPDSWINTVHNTDTVSPHAFLSWAVCAQATPYTP